MHNDVIKFKYNRGYLKIEHIDDETKPCFSVQHFTENDTPGEIQVTFSDDKDDLDILAYQMQNKYDKPEASTNDKIKQKINYDQLILEITRRCNMNCEHCLRGEPENKDMPFEIAKQVLDSAANINTLTLTGGEPTLNLDLLEQIIDYAKEKQIPIEHFYIVTNGKEISDRFMKILLDYWLYTNIYAQEYGYSGVALSIDEYHEPIPFENKIKLKAFSFYTDDKEDINQEKTLINMGRAKNLTGVKKFDKTISDLYNEVYDGQIYLPEDTYITVDGDILGNCDLSYDIMKEHVYGNIMNYDEFINKIIKENEE